MSLLITSKRPIFRPSYSAPGGGGGSLVDGQSFTINTSGLESLTDATPRRFDRFNGTNGSQVTGWTLYKNDEFASTVYPKYSNAQSFDGGTCAELSFLGTNQATDAQYNCTIEEQSLASQRKIYVWLAMRFSKLDGTASRNVKFTRVTAGDSGGGIYDLPTLGWTVFGNQVPPGMIVYGHRDASQGFSDDHFIAVDDIIYPSLMDTWMVHELYGDLGTYNTQNGSCWAAINRTLLGNGRYSNVLFDTVNRSFQWLTLPYYVARDNSGSETSGQHKMWMGGIYASREEHAESRLELSNSATYAGGVRIPQPRISQSTTQVVFTAYKGSLNFSNPVYAYSTKKDGTTRISHGQIN